MIPRISPAGGRKENGGGAKAAAHGSDHMTQTQRRKVEGSQEAQVFMGDSMLREVMALHRFWCPGEDAEGGLGHSLALEELHGVGAL